jgi:hypothetical protein
MRSLQTTRQQVLRLDRAPTASDYWPDLGEVAELYSLGWPLLAIRLGFILPLLTIRVVPAITVRDPAIAVRVGSILVSDTYWF